MDASAEMLEAINAEPLKYTLPEVKAAAIVDNFADWPKEVEP